MRWTLTFLLMMTLGFVTVGCEPGGEDPVIDPAPVTTPADPADPPADPTVDQDSDIIEP